MILLIAAFLGFFQQSHAADITVVDVRRNITLAEDDPVYKDFYINAGPGSGLKKNLVVTAVRKINIRDASGANAVGEILVPVGQLKIIAIYDRVAVAREFTLLSRDELPMLEQTGIMSGDRIDLQGAFMDTSKPKKHKVAEEVTTTTVVVTALTAPAVTAQGSTPSPGNPAPVKAENPVVSAHSPAEDLLKASTAPVAEAKPVESLEKVADSGNNTQHE